MITGSGNVQLKTVRQLLRSRALRDQLGLFAAEGVKIVLEAPAEAVAAVYVSEAFAAENGALLRERGFAESAEGSVWWEKESPGSRTAPAFTVVSDSRFGSICDTKNPQGVTAVLRKPVWRAEAVFSRKAPLLIAAEHLQDPGNAGTILRTAEAAGADAVIFAGESVDIFNPKVVRATMGSIFRMPVFYENDAAPLFRKMRENGIRSYAAYLPGSTVYDGPDYTGGTCFWIGNESRGLAAETAEAADERIRIPMTEHINSLNAAMAAGILLYEAARQRRNK